MPTNGPAPAVANAIFDAVGVRLRALPFTPERVLRALKEKEVGKGGAPAAEGITAVSGTAAATAEKAAPTDAAATAEKKAVASEGSQSAPDEAEEDTTVSGCGPD
jgi:hypothetical protein